MFLGQALCNHNGGIWGPPQRAYREVKIKHDLMTRKCKYTLMA